MSPALRLPGVSRDLQDRRDRPARPEKMALLEWREPRDQLVPQDLPALLVLPALPVRLERRATQESRETSKTTQQRPPQPAASFILPLNTNGW